MSSRSVSLPLNYLGKVVGQGQVRPVEAKVFAVQKFPPPTTKKELMRFLGLVGYHRSFCKNFSSVVVGLLDYGKNHNHDYFDIVITIIKDDYSLI